MRWAWIGRAWIRSTLDEGTGTWIPFGGKDPVPNASRCLLLLYSPLIFVPDTCFSSIP